VITRSKECIQSKLETRVKLGRITGTWNKEGNARGSQVLEKQYAQGSDVTSRSNGTPNTTSFLSIAYLE
jgi:hypothetical protein